MTYQDKNVNDIINDEDYPKKNILDELVKRVDNINLSINKTVGVSAIEYEIRNMTFARIIPEEDYVQLIIVLPYDRIIDLAGRCDVKYHTGINGSDIISYNVENAFDIQYAVSIANQSFVFHKRLKL